MLPCHSAESLPGASAQPTHAAKTAALTILRPLHCPLQAAPAATAACSATRARSCLSTPAPTSPPSISGPVATPSLPNHSSRLPTAAPGAPSVWPWSPPLPATAACSAATCCGVMSATPALCNRCSKPPARTGPLRAGATHGHAATTALSPSPAPAVTGRPSSPSITAHASPAAECRSRDMVAATAAPSTAATVTSLCTRSAHAAAETSSPTPTAPAPTGRWTAPAPCST